MPDDPRTDEYVSQEQESPRREYRRPELRELGTLTELTHATPTRGPNADASYNTSS
jgi:hypothetical protein